MFGNIGNRLLGALSVTGRFKTHEAQAISDELGTIERGLWDKLPKPEPVEATPEFYPNRAQRSQLRREKRFRCTRNAAFHQKRGSPIMADGLPAIQGRITHAGVNNKGVHIIHNKHVASIMVTTHKDADKA